MSRTYETCDRTGLRIRVNRKYLWTPADGNVTASLEVSIGNPRCRGQYLECLCNWIAKRFGSFEVSLGDTLRVHNYISIGHPQYGILSPKVAHEIATAEGDAWIAENMATVNAYFGQCEPTRWDKWKSLPTFDHAYRQLKMLFQKRREFHDVVLTDIDRYIRRHSDEVRDDSYQARTRMSEYIIEELAVYQIQAQRRPTANVYPGGMLRTAAAVQQWDFIPATLRRRQYIYVEIHPKVVPGEEGKADA